MADVRRKLWPVALALLILAVAGLTAPALAKTSATKPSLRLAKRYPLTLAASGFRPGERATVVVVVPDRTLERRTRASATGSFVVLFSGVRVGRCDAVSARATGRAGSRAVLRMVAPACSES